VYKRGQHEGAGRAYALISLPWRGSSPAPDTGATVITVPVSASPRNLDESILTGNGPGPNKASGPSPPFAFRLSSFPRLQNPRPWQPTLRFCMTRRNPQPGRASAHGCIVSFSSVWVLIQPGRSDRLFPLRIHELANVGGGIFRARGLLKLCSQCSSEGGLCHEGYIAGSFRTGVPTSRDRSTQERSEGGGTSYDRCGQTRPCQRSGHEYFPWRVRAAADETPEARSVHFAHGIPE
jgi:hypothetical protein